VDPAWIGLAGGVIGTAASGLIAVRQGRESQRLARLNGELQEDLARLEGRLQADLARLGSDLEVERHERAAQFDRGLRAEDVLARYREPLAVAAFDLQSRCYNLLRLDFLEKFGTSHERFGTAQKTTLFRFAQYFGWTEILRRNIQFLSFPTADETRKVIELQWMISRRFGTSEDHQGMMVWTDEQRAIGERMIIKEHDVVLCMGYARFEEEYPAHFEQWCEHLRAPLQAAEARPRLIELQRMLCELVRRLDPDGMRYNSDLDSA
jgi:hypothetical protein